MLNLDRQLVAAVAVALVLGSADCSSPSPEAPRPTNLTYLTNPAVYELGASIYNSPSSSGGMPESYWVTPPLPSGLYLSNSTGVIAGRPAAVAATASYTVTASNSGGSTTTRLTITVQESAARTSHTATLLPSGKVLIAGGYFLRSGTPLAGAELYDPATGSFTQTGSLGVPRWLHTATLLPNGTVLIAGGNSPNLATAMLYDPATRTFTATGSMGTARREHSATLLPGGKVLIAGGFLDTRIAENSYYVNALASAELFDPATGTFIPTGSMGAARQRHTATLLPSGKVLIAGPEMFVAGGNPTAELYDPVTGTFAATGSMLDTPPATLTPGLGHTATLLPSGKVLIAGGTYPPATSAELYDPVTGTFAATGSMSATRDSHTATLLPSGKVLIAGGADDQNVPATAEVYDPATGTFTEKGSMGAARQRHTTTLLPSGKVLIAAGAAAGPLSTLATAELYDPATGTFAPTGDLGGSSPGGSITGTVGGQPLHVEEAVFGIEAASKVIRVFVSDRIGLCSLLAGTILPGTTTVLALEIVDVTDGPSTEDCRAGDYTWADLSRSFPPPGAHFLYFDGTFGVFPSCTTLPHVNATDGALIVTQAGDSSGTHLEATLTNLRFGTDTLNGNVEATYCPAAVNPTCVLGGP